MRVLLVVLLMLAGAVFAVQNAAVVSVTVFLWRFEASLAIVIGVCVAFGTALGALVALPSLHRKSEHETSIQAQLAELDATDALNDSAGATPQDSAAARPSGRL